MPREIGQILHILVEQKLSERIVQAVKGRIIYFSFFQQGLRCWLTCMPQSPCSSYNASGHIPRYSSQCSPVNRTRPQLSRQSSIASITSCRWSMIDKGTFLSLWHLPVYLIRLEASLTSRPCAKRLDIPNQFNWKWQWYLIIVITNVYTPKMSAFSFFFIKVKRSRGWSPCLHKTTLKLWPSRLPFLTRLLVRLFGTRQPLNVLLEWTGRKISISFLGENRCNHLIVDCLLCC